MHQHEIADRRRDCQAKALKRFADPAKPRFIVLNGTLDVCPVADRCCTGNDCKRIDVEWSAHPAQHVLDALTGVALRAQTLVQSTAVAKTLNFTTNVASLAVFLIAGQLVWIAGAAMIGGQLLGSYVASHVLFRVKPVVLRVLIVVMSLGMLVRVLIG